MICVSCSVRKKKKKERRQGRGVCVVEGGEGGGGGGGVGGGGGGWGGGGGGGGGYLGLQVSGGSYTKWRLARLINRLSIAAWAFSSSISS